MSDRKIRYNNFINIHICIMCTCTCFIKSKCNLNLEKKNLVDLIHHQNTHQDSTIWLILSNTTHHCVPELITLKFCVYIFVTRKNSVYLYLSSPYPIVNRPGTSLTSSVVTQDVHSSHQLIACPSMYRVNYIHKNKFISPTQMVLCHENYIQKYRLCYKHVSE